MLRIDYASSEDHTEKEPRIFFSMNSRKKLGWILILVLIQAMFIVQYIRDSGNDVIPEPPLSRKSTVSTVRVDMRSEDCENGRVFVYDLPSMFNTGFLENCKDLDPWKSRCAALSNGGFGPKAAKLDNVVPRNLTAAWYWTDMYAAEVIFHVRMLNYKCRAMSPDEATAFYVPFYPGLAVGKYLWSNYTERDRPGKMVLEWLKNQPSWKKHAGADHFMTFGRLTWAFRRQRDDDSDWGTSLMYMPLMKNVLKIGVERNTWDDLEFSVPYPTAFHPRSEYDIREWQAFVQSRERRSLFSFVGATRKKIKNDYRAFLMDYCKGQPEGTCQAVDCSETVCSDGAPEILEAFLGSDFCLQPIGDGATRRSFFDCMIAGSIPVYLWEKSFKGQYEWHMPSTAVGSYYVFVDHEDVRRGRVSIAEKLEEISKVEVRKMREKLIDLIPRILYVEPSKGLENVEDAFDVTVQNVLRRLDFNSLTI